MDKHTYDEFLGGRLKIAQHSDGHRSGTDAVLLAAAIGLNAGEKALELGCGAGAASLCLAARVPQAHTHGVDIDPELVALACSNAETNHFESADFAVQDIHAPLSVWTLQEGYDHVFANPPFYSPRSTQHPPNTAKKTAHIARPDTIEVWVRRAVGLVKGRGYVTFIHLAEALPALLDAMAPRLGGLEVLPLAPKAGLPAKRILVRGRRDSKAAMRLLSPLVMHEPEGVYTPIVEEILRHGAALDWGKAG